MLLSLIGEQPIPNLLPIRHLQPAENLLVYTTRTRERARLLRKLIGGLCPLGAKPSPLASRLRYNPIARSNKQSEEQPHANA